MPEQAESVASIRVAERLPARCPSCFGSPAAMKPGVKFVNFNDAHFDAGAVVGEHMQIIDSLDELILCEDCVRRGAEALKFKPELHQRQLREITRLETQVEHWKATAKRLQNELNTQLAAA